MQKNKHIIIGVLIIIFALIAAVSLAFRPSTPDKAINTSDYSVVESDLNMNNSTSPAPAVDTIIDTKAKYQAVLKTEKGDITIDLYADKTPITVNNFVSLAKKNFYNNTIFHRVIDGFMIQGGDPKGDGTGGPGYTFDDEKFDGEYTRGTIAMANAGPNTNGSQFFIMHQDYPLPKNYVIFGKVSKGIEVVDAIATSEVRPGGEGSTPVTPVKVLSVEIIEN